jgi:hypothetical protein
MIASCMYSSKNELGLFVLMLFVVTILFSSAIFFCEKDQEDTDFDSIPMSFWWAIATMTTVGYGDMVPVSPVCWAINYITVSLGVISIAIPARCAFSDRNSHSRMPLDPGYVRLKQTCV